MSPSPQLRFDRAQYGSSPPREAGRCTFCGRPLGGQHFDVVGRPACEPCGRQALDHIPADSPRHFVSALTAGTVTALGAGLAFAGLLAKLPTFSAQLWVGYFGAIALGWLLGRVMRIASQGIGGRRYQVAAVLLSYAAVIFPMQVTMAGIPAMPAYLYPLILLRPFLFFFTGLHAMATWQLLAAFLGARLAWAMTRGGPFTVRPVHSSSHGKPE